MEQAPPNQVNQYAKSISEVFFAVPFVFFTLISCIPTIVLLGFISNTWFYHDNNFTNQYTFYFSIFLLYMSGGVMIYSMFSKKGKGSYAQLITLARENKAASRVGGIYGGYMSIFLPLFIASETLFLKSYFILYGGFTNGTKNYWDWLIYVLSINFDNLTFGFFNSFQITPTNIRAIQLLPEIFIYFNNLLLATIIIKFIINIINVINTLGKMAIDQI